MVRRTKEVIWFVWFVLFVFGKGENMNKKYIIRRREDGWDRSSCSYVVERPNVKRNEKVARKFRFAKVALNNAAKFNKRRAKNVLESVSKKADYVEIVPA